MSALGKRVALDYLKNICTPVERQEESEVILNLLRFLQTQNTFCLTGPEIGLFKRAAIIRTKDFSIDLVNPEIVTIYTNQKVTSINERCVSFPGDRLNCVRYNKIEIINGLDRKRITLTGLPAVWVQHAIDHLDGIVFYDRAIRLALIQKDNIIHWDAYL